jgi:acylphosphatase
MGLERLRIFYSGRVQGVGFRATAHRLAQDRPVGGFVRNLDDGRVELLIEGDSADVHAVLAAIDRSLGDKIRDLKICREPPGEDSPDGFVIRYH